LGLIMIKGIEKGTIQRIISERQLRGKFLSFDDFMDRVYVGIEQTILLLKVNAFRFTGIDKHALMWQVHIKIGNSSSSEVMPKLFSPNARTFKIPDVHTNAIIEAYDQIELIGFPLCGYFKLLDRPLPKHTKVKDFKNYVNKTIEIYGKRITAKPTSTQKGQLMYFGTFLDEDGDIFDTVHFPEVAKRYSIASNGIYRIKGKVVEDLGYYSIIADEVEKEAVVPDPRHVANHKIESK